MVLVDPGPYPGSTLPVEICRQPAANFKSMTPDPVNLLVLFLGVGAAFLISRWIATRWKARRRDRSDQAARAAESRQVRRARERRGRQ